MKTSAEKERAADRKLEEADEILLCKRQMRQNVCFGWKADAPLATLARKGEARMKRFLIMSALMLAGCGSDTNTILDTDPFLSAHVDNPADGSLGVLKRSRSFARQHGMNMESSTSHFEAGEYSALLKRHDLNIFVANVGRGRTTSLTAYVRAKPEEIHRNLVEQYQCAVFYACGLKKQSTR